VAGNHRTSRLTEEPSSGQRTLDSAAPAPAAPTTAIDPPELLEPPPSQNAASRLEERQKRWLEMREQAISSAENGSSSTPGSAENPPSEPKG
jgi:hypothetical protein